MILCNAEILEALDDGRVIEPQPSPREPPTAPEHPECPYQTSAVDLRLFHEISVYDPDTQPVNIDLSCGGFAKFASRATTQEMLTDDRPFVLQPNRFILGRTHEKVALPLQEGADKSLAARVEGRSSYARCGLLVHFTAPTIHVGCSGTIALEIMNLGHYAITLRPRMPICQLIIEEVRGVPFQNESQFQGQNRPTGE